MVARYELVAIDAYNNGKVLDTKTGSKLTLQQLDLFTTTFTSPEHLTFYLKEKGYLQDFEPINYAAVYKANKTDRYLNCFYKNDTDIINLAKSSSSNNKVNEYCGVYRKIINEFFQIIKSKKRKEFLDHILINKYINEYVYNKIIDYLVKFKNNAPYKVLLMIERQITRELTKEYLQVRKLYEAIKTFKMYKVKLEVEQKNNKRKIIKGEYNEPYIEYLITRANKGDDNAHEELMAMELEKTKELNLRRS